MTNYADRLLKGADARQARDTFDPNERAAYLNASEAMSCIRKQWYAKNDTPTDGPEDWGYARRGTHMETYMVDCLHAANVPLLFAGDQQVQLVDEDRRLSCTPDGLIDCDDHYVAVEFKSIDPRTNVSKNLPRSEHVAQVQIAAALWNAPAIRSALSMAPAEAKPVARCLLMYMDASNYNKIHEFPVPLGPSNLLDTMAVRAKRVLSTQRAERLTREGKKRDQGRECKQRCKYNRVCGVDKEVEGSTATGRGNKGSSLHAAVLDYAKGKSLEAEAKALTSAAGEAIKEELKARDVSTITVDAHEIKLAKTAGRVTLDRKAMEKAGIDLSPYEKVGAPSERLTVTETQ